VTVEPMEALEDISLDVSHLDQITRISIQARPSVPTQQDQMIIKGIKGFNS